MKIMMCLLLLVGGLSFPSFSLASKAPVPEKGAPQVNHSVDELHEWSLPPMKLDQKLKTSSIPDVYYWRGIQSYQGKRWMQARNEWVKYLRWCEGRVIPEKRRLFLKEYIQGVDWVRSVTKPTPEKEAPRKPRKSKIKNKQPLVNKIHPDVSFEKLVENAQEAEAAGHMEMAMKLYELAEYGGWSPSAHVKELRNYFE